LEVAGRDVLEPDDHPQDRRLPAAARPDEDDELAVGDLQADALHREEAVAVLLDDVPQDYRGHGVSPRVGGQPLTAPWVRPATIWRWNSRTRTTTGMVTMTAAAEMEPVGSSNWDAPVKKARAAGTGRARSVDVREMP